MKIAILIDPIKNLNRKTDSTLYIYQQLKQSEFKPLLFTEENLKISAQNINNTPTITANCFNIDENLTPIAFKMRNLEEFNIIMLRQDPPVNTNFIANIQILSLLKKPKIINNPQTILKYPEKFIPLEFPQHIPQTIITRSDDEIMKFMKQNKKAVLKSVHGHGGNEVILVTDSQHNKIQSFMAQHGCVIAQEFLSQVEKGDKRVLLLNGKLAGTLRRIPQKGSILANMVQGASGQIDQLTKGESKIIDEVAAWLIEKDVFFAGLDLIDGKLIEVNITCPTGFKVYHNLAQHTEERKQVQELLTTELAGL